MKYLYSAILTPRAAGGYDCTVPDIPHCFTSGADIPEALSMIEDAATLLLVAFEDDGRPIPVPTPPEQVRPEPGSITSLLVLDTDAYRRQYDTSPVRESVSIPAWMDRQARQRGLSFSQVLQDSLRQILA